jgi:hypothetical protein
MAQAKPNPSYVDVPRPSSSIIIREFSVAFYLENVKECTKLVWYSMAWYGMVWYGMVWHGIV